MSKMRARVGRLPWFVSLLALTACSLRSAPVSASSPGSGADVLIYCDYTPGTVPLLAAWKAGLTAEQRSAVIVSETAPFVNELERRAWPEVLVLARHAAAEPAYADALRQYVDRNPSAPVDLYFWHDNGQEPVKGTAVFADGAWVFWRHGFTTIGYMAKGAKPASSTTGHVFPNFAGLQIQNPVIVERLELTAERSLLSWPALFLQLLEQFDTECERDAFKAFMERIKLCNADYDKLVTLCDRRWPEPRTPEQALQWIDCLRGAAEGRNDCYKNAHRIYKLEYELCQQP